MKSQRETRFSFRRDSRSCWQEKNTKALFSVKRIMVPSDPEVSEDERCRIWEGSRGGGRAGGKQTCFGSGATNLIISQKGKFCERHENVWESKEAVGVGGGGGGEASVALQRGRRGSSSVQAGGAGICTGAGRELFCSFCGAWGHEL